MVNILIVDSEGKNTELLKELLLPGNYNLSRVNTGSQVLNTLKKNEVDIVFFDVMSPDMAEVLKGIKQDDILRTLPVILIAPADDKEKAIQGLCLGADDYITKPFGCQELSARIKPHLKISLLRGELAQKEKLVRIIDIENRLKYNFLSLVSHKFKTPITLVLNYIDFIKTTTKEEEIIRLARKVEQGQEELVSLMDKLFYFLEIESDSLSEIVSIDAVDNIFSRLKEKYNTAAVFKKDIGVKEIYLWQQVIMGELMDNAFRFYRGKELIIDLMLKDNYMEISDNGRGLSPKEKDKILNLFYQTEKYFNDNSSCVGLGLSLVKKLLELYKGRLEIESEVNNGTKFKIYFAGQAA